MCTHVFFAKVPGAYFFYCLGTPPRGVTGFLKVGDRFFGRTPSPQGSSNEVWLGGMRVPDHPSLPLRGDLALTLAPQAWKVQFENNQQLQDFSRKSHSLLQYLISSSCLGLDGIECLPEQFPQNGFPACDKHFPMEFVQFYTQSCSLSLALMVGAAHFLYPSCGLLCQP